MPEMNFLVFGISMQEIEIHLDTEASQAVESHRTDKLSTYGGVSTTSYISIFYYEH